ncbi:MAG: HNH endonuclease signature motif containing protein [Chloroflexota bacterium]
MTRVPDALRRTVYGRAEGKCEYCLLHERYTVKRHHIDHITAEKHGGATDITNLCLSCAACNHYKGSDLTSIDPVTGKVIQLFHPRKDRWHQHFRFEGALIQGITARGRVTVRLLHLNDEDSVNERTRLMELGAYP